MCLFIELSILFHSLKCRYILLSILFLLILNIGYAQSSESNEFLWKNIATQVVDFKMPTTKFQEEHRDNGRKDIGRFFIDNKIDSSDYYSASGTYASFNLNISWGKIDSSKIDGELNGFIDGHDEMVAEPYCKLSHVKNKKENDVVSFEARWTTTNFSKRKGHSEFVISAGVEIYKNFLIMYAITNKGRKELAELEYFLENLKFKKEP